jgi:hypothetical protein
VCRGKERGEEFYFRSLCIPTLRWEEEPCHSLSPMAFGQGEDLRELTHTPMLILKYPKSMQEEIPTLINRTCN